MIFRILHTAFPVKAKTADLCVQTGILCQVRFSVFTVSDELRCVDAKASFRVDISTIANQFPELFILSKQFYSVLCTDEKRLISCQYTCWIAEWRDILSINKIQYTLRLWIAYLYHAISGALL